MKSFTQSFKIEIQPHGLEKICFLVVWPNVWEREEIEMEMRRVETQEAKQNEFV